MFNLAIEKTHLKSLIEGRKMSFDDVVKKYESNDNTIIFNKFEDLQNLSNQLDVPLKDFFKENDLQQGVKIGRKNECFSRTIEKNGVEYYTYNHLATTKTEPNLMALRVNLHCKELDKIVLNGGHSSKEIVYITKGKVRMDWETSEGRQHTELNVGDSAYVSPDTSHSFVALEDNSELIAINY